MISYPLGRKATYNGESVTVWGVSTILTTSNQPTTYAVIEDSTGNQSSVLVDDLIYSDTPEAHIHKAVKMAIMTAATGSWFRLSSKRKDVPVESGEFASWFLREILS